MRALALPLGFDRFIETMVTVSTSFDGASCEVHKVELFEIVDVHFN